MIGDAAVIGRNAFADGALLMVFVWGPVIGLLKGRYEYDAQAFDDADDEIREMFYGADA